MKQLTAMLVAVLSTNLYSCHSVEKDPAVQAHTTIEPGVLHVTGAYALAPLMQVWADSFNLHHPGSRIEITPLGSGYALSILRNRQTDIAMLSGDLTSWADTQIWLTPVVKSPVMFLVSSRNPWLENIRKSGLNAHQLKDIFTGKTTSWGALFGKPGKDSIHCYIRNDSAGATDMICRYLWIDSTELTGIGKEGETDMRDALINDPLAIAYCNFVYSIDLHDEAFRKEVAIIPLDLDYNGTLESFESFYHEPLLLQRAVWSGRYPCSLNRTLYLATRGKPENPDIVGLFRYILTDGQLIGRKLGYCELQRSENYFRLFLMEDADSK